LKKPTFNSGDVDADVIVVGSGVVGALVANQLAAAGRSVVILEAGPRLERAEVVQNWRNASFERRIGSDFQGPYRQSPLATAPLYFPPNDYVALSGPDANGFQQGFLRPSAAPPGIGPRPAGATCRSTFKMKSTYGVGRDWPIDYDGARAVLLPRRRGDGRVRAERPGTAIARVNAASRTRWTWCRGAMATTFAEVVNAHGYNLGADSAGPQHAALE
jgi:hypothetical protein